MQPNFVNRQCPLSSHDRNTMLQLKRQETDAKKLNIITLEEESVSPRFAPKSIDYFSMSSYSVNIPSFYRHHSKVGEVILTHRVSKISFHPPQRRKEEKLCLVLHEHAGIPANIFINLSKTTPES